MSTHAAGFPPSLPRPVGTPSTQSWARTILEFFPEFLITNVALWTCAVAAIWSIGSILNLPPPLFALWTAMVGGPTLWLTAHTIRLALVRPGELEKERLEAARYPAETPSPGENESRQGFEGIDTTAPD